MLWKFFNELTNLRKYFKSCYAPGSSLFNYLVHMVFTHPQNIYNFSWSKGYRMLKVALNAAAMSLSKALASRDIAVGIYHSGYVQTDMENYGGDISVNGAASRLVGLINHLTMAESGVFKYSNGEVLPW